MTRPPRAAPSSTSSVTAQRTLTAVSQPESLFRGASTTVREIVVVVPAANEGGSIGRCLDALLVARQQLAASHPDVESSVVVVLDGCHDGTAAAVRRYRDVDSVTTSVRCVGAARRAGTSRALARSRHPREQVWVASTDADSQVPAQWLTGLCQIAETGYHAMLGTVRPDLDISDAVEAEWYRRHCLTDGHPHVHGANMSVRADVYDAIGGWAMLASGEDDDLASRLADHPEVAILRTGRHPVTTSARAIGRAPRGFSGYLRGLADEVQVPPRSRCRPLT